MSDEETQLVENESLRTSQVPKRYFCFGFVVSLVIIGIIAGSVAGWFYSNNQLSPYALSDSVDVDNIMDHLKAFQETSKNQTNGSRSVTNGYKYSAEYVVSQLKTKAKCDISTQNFTVPVYVEVSPPILSAVSPFQINYQLSVDFQQPRYAGNGVYNITEDVCVVSNEGCNTTDFSGAPKCIALLQLANTLDCFLIDIALNAEKFGASALLIYNSPNRKSLLNSRIRSVEWFEGDPIVSIPVLSLSYSAGFIIANTTTQTPVKLNVISNTRVDIVETFNVFCTTKEGNPNNTVMAGSHLDSVPEGPGINDNGSGSASLLEIVLQWYKLKLQPVNRIRFAWWGAEEIGLLGSRNYVKYLQQNDTEEFEKIVSYLNFDMLASPNYNAGIHNGSSAVVESIRNGSMYITNTFMNYFSYISKPYVLQPLGSGSDFVPFAESGIPSGGLLAGAGGIKSMNERTKFGGFANAPYDPCYHLICDTVENINQDCLGQMSGAASYTIQHLAFLENIRNVVQYNSTNKHINLNKVEEL